MKNQFRLTAITLMLVSMMASCSMEKKDTSADFKLKIDQYVAYWNTGQFDGIDDLLSEDFELRMTPRFESENGIDVFMENVTNWRMAYPDFYITLDEILYADNAAAARWTITATNTGTGSHPPTGKRVEVQGMSVIHFTDGKIKDEWIASNNYHWLQQLGFTLEAPSFE